MLHILTLTLVFLEAIYGWPSGAPAERCESMTPGHGTEQTGPNPYSLSLTVTQYKSGMPVSVMISGGDFKGLMLQARKVGTTEIVGTFTDPGAASNLKLLACGGVSGSAVTHANTTIKKDATLMWNPPTMGTYDIEFVATVNAEKLEWWKNTKSVVLSHMAAPGSEPEPETTASVLDGSGIRTDPFAVMYLLFLVLVKIMV